MFRALWLGLELPTAKVAAGETGYVEWAAWSPFSKFESHGRKGILIPIEEVGGKLLMLAFWERYINKEEPVVFSISNTLGRLFPDDYLTAQKAVHFIGQFISRPDEVHSIGDVRCRLLTEAEVKERQDKIKVRVQDMLLDTRHLEDGPIEVVGTIKK